MSHYKSSAPIHKIVILFVFLLTVSLHADEPHLGKVLTKFLEKNRGKAIVEIPKEIKHIKVRYLFYFSTKPPLPSKGNEDVLALFLKGEKFKYRYLFSVDRNLQKKSKDYTIGEVLANRKIVEYTVHRIEGANIYLQSFHFKKANPVKK